MTIYVSCAKEMCGKGVENPWRRDFLWPKKAKTLKMASVSQKEKPLWVTAWRMWRGASPSYPHYLWISFLRIMRSFSHLVEAHFH